MTVDTKPVWGLSAAHLVTDLYSPVLPAILPLLIAEQGYSFFLAGLIVTVYNLTSSFVQPLVGWVFDTRGFAVHVGTSVAISAIFISIVGLLDNYYIVLASVAVAALGHAFFHPSALGTVSRLTGDANRGRITSYFVIGGNLGYAVGPICAGVAVGLMGLPGLVILAVPGLVMAVVLRRILPAPDRDAVPETRIPAAKPSYRAVALLVAASGLRAWAIFGSVAFLPTILTMRGFDLVTANILVSGTLIAGVVGQVVGGVLSDRYGRKEYTIIGLVTAIPPFVVFLTTGGILSLVALMIFGFILWSTFAVTVAMAHEIAPGNVGVVSGLMLGLAVGVGGLGVSVTGWIADMTTLTLGLTTIPLAIVLAVPLFLAVPYPWKSLVRGRLPSRG
ncbi:MFS transporter [Methanoculleus sp. YWC-01]|uniref:MFS transporter n=1 Tax=Methanoculleus nereidis TaxID=2735141 RepID=A0ABU3Z1L0_9EURY|nr:MFS transporter [Methanoculleus sp. YWC-01]MCK9299057.1 MFS transporter [Methanoculleus sp.]MDV4342475.1 MFS transporter [Methanoculleus sp. YWC-01]PKL57009.1 MAG: MFS transporter [Methanomicrobiales archaeon HGW-Methanomicrobiales-6]